MGRHRTFTPATMRFEGQTRRAFKLVCGHCDKPGMLSVNTIRGHANNDEVESGLIRTKFQKSGWKVGDREGEDRCPSCFAKILSANAKRRNDKGDNRVVNLHPSPPAQPLDQPDAVKEMGIEERRLVFGKLDEHYPSKERGYADGWNDVRVATDLGVPINWIKQVREQMFGPEDGDKAKLKEDLAEINKTVAALFTELNSCVTRFNNIKNEYVAVRDQVSAAVSEGEKIKARLAACEATLLPSRVA